MSRRRQLLDEEKPPTRKRLNLEARRVRLFNELVFERRAAYGLVTRRDLAAMFRELDRALPLDDAARSRRARPHRGRRVREVASP